MRARSVAASLALVIAACDDKPKPSPPDATVDVAVTPPPATSTAAPIVDAARPPPCRITSWENTAPNTGDPATLLTLADKAAISIRMNDTTRELRFEGPGRVKACGGEVSFVLEGTVASLPGGGESPGAEQWVASPCAAMRWANGHHRMTVTSSTCKIQSSGPSLDLYIPPDMRAKDTADAGVPDAGALPDRGDDGFVRINGRRALDLTGVFTGPAPIKSSIVACRSMLGALERLTKPDAGKGDDDDAGGRAAAAIYARRLARASCAVALARVRAGGLGKPAAPDEEASLQRSFQGIFAF